MKTEILFQILTLLINKRKVTRDYLCDRFELSPRTITRYICSLADSGVPIVSEHGIGGGISIADDYKLNATFFTEKELERIKTCLKALDGNFSDDVNTMIIDKLLNVNYNKQKDNFIINTPTLFIDAGPWSNPDLYRTRIDILKHAIEQRVSVNLKYRDNDGYFSSRLVDPYTLVLKEGIWYIYCWCNLRHDFRLFKLSRIISMTETANEYIFRDNNIHDKLSFRGDESELVHIVFEFSEFILTEIEEWVGGDCIEERGTKYVADTVMYGGNYLLRRLMSFGSSIKVISPKAIAEELMIESNRLIARYQKV